MEAYLNDKNLKGKFINEIKKHMAADAIIKGSYGEEEDGGWRGCAVGCSLKSLNTINKKDDSTEAHNRYESELGIPEELAWLEDRIFEGLPIEDAKKWPLQFAMAIEEGRDLSKIATQFKLWLFDEENDVYKNAFPDGKKAIKLVVKVLKEFLNTGIWPESAANAARFAAWGAAWGAESAASAVESAESAARSAAWGAASAASAARSAANAARSAAYKKQADKLLELLRTA